MAFKEFSGGVQAVSEMAGICDLEGTGAGLPKMCTWILLFVGLKSKQD